MASWFLRRHSSKDRVELRFELTIHTLTYHSGHDASSTAVSSSPSPSTQPPPRYITWKRGKSAGRTRLCDGERRGRGVKYSWEECFALTCALHPKRKDRRTTRSASVPLVASVALGPVAAAASATPPTASPTEEEEESPSFLPKSLELTAREADGKSLGSAHVNLAEHARTPLRKRNVILSGRYAPVLCISVACGEAATAAREKEPTNQHVEKGTACQATDNRGHGKDMGTSLEPPLEPLESLLESLCDQVTCSICLGVMCEPVTLPCMHSFCRECVERATRSRSLTCPLCRRVFPLDNLRTAWASNFLLRNIIQQLHETESVLQETPQAVLSTKTTPPPPLVGFSARSSTPISSSIAVPTSVAAAAAATATAAAAAAAASPPPPPPPLPPLPPASRSSSSRLAVVGRPSNPNEQVQPFGNAYLPFVLPPSELPRLVADWMASLWFAPGELKGRDLQIRSLACFFVPFWHMVADVSTHFSCEVQREGRVDEWERLEGVHSHSCDSLHCASSRIPHLTELGPWPMSLRVPTRDDLYTDPSPLHGPLSRLPLARFEVMRASGVEEEELIVEVKPRTVPWVTARREMSGEKLRHTAAQACRASIAMHHGVRQIRSFTTRPGEMDARFCYVFLPVFRADYTYRESAYSVLINGHTGRVRGDRPFSVNVRGLLDVGSNAIRFLSSAFRSRREEM